MKSTTELSYSPRQLIAEIFDLDPAELFNEQAQGQINLTDALLHLQIYQQETANVLILLADLGALPSENRQAIYQLLLVANSGWRDIAGGALCTDDSGARALLRLRLDLNTLSAETLTQWLIAFVTAAETWAQRLAAPIPSVDALSHYSTNPLIDIHPFNKA